MKNPLVSLIIPVHNAENFIVECLDSALNQTYKNIEIITVNDASTDTSANILKQYAKNNKNIHYLEVKNGNAAKTRRDGIKQSKADFVCFVDADDILDVNYVDYLYKAMVETKTNIAACNLETFTGEYKTQQTSGKVSPKTILSDADSFADHYHITEDNKLTLQTLTAKLFKKELFDTIDYSVLVTNIFEDNFIMAQVLSRVDKISVIDNKLYWYRQATHTTSSDTVKTKVEINGKTLNFIEFFNDIVMEYCRSTLKGKNVNTAIDRLSKVEFFNYARMVPDLKLHTDYLEEKVALCEDYLNGRDEQINAILNSKSYKVGHAIVKPASKIVKAVKNRK